MVKHELPINPGLLKWARKDVALSLEEAADRAGITALKPHGNKLGKAPEERLEAWENGEFDISLRQLEALAKVYRRPLLTFFLSSPPVKKQSVADFRIAPSDKIRGDSPEFAAFMRRIEALHEDLVVLVEEEGGEQVQFVGSLTLGTPVTQAAENIRNVLAFSMNDQRKVRGKESLLNTLRMQIHSAGIFTLFEGDLGSHHTKISPNEFRGIALCHSIAPLLVVNPNDAKAAQLFTLLHELTHLGLGKSSVSNLDAWNDSSRTGSNEVETYCNMVAGEFLVPTSEILNLPSIDAMSLYTVVEELSRHFKVSGMVIARRLLEVRVINNDTYRELYLVFKKRWDERARKQREHEGPINSLVVRKSRLGGKLVSTVMGAVNDGRISLQDASRILGIRVGHFDRIAG